MTNVQQWLKENYPKSQREKVIELSIKGKTGQLDLSDFINLEKLTCLGNFFTSIIFPANPINLKELYLFESGLVGSLDFLTSMKNLKIISIIGNDFDKIDIDKLPKSLTKINIHFGSQYFNPVNLISQWEEVKFGFCQNCFKLNTSRGWCHLCDNKELEKYLDELSEKEVIEKFIQKLGKNIFGNYKLQWIPFECFADIEYLDEGGYGKIYRAKWKYSKHKLWHNPYNNLVLKSLHDSKKLTMSFLSEIIDINLVNDFNKAPFIVKCWGFSFNPITKEYVIVMDHIRGGNLWEFLEKNSKDLSLEIKLEKLYNIAMGLQFIHKQNLIHRDLHPGNILNDEFGGGDGDGIDRSFITDLGQCSPIKESKNESFGIVRYMAPEILSNNFYTSAGDVYSFSVVAYELLSNSIPYYDEFPNLKVDDSELGDAICEGLRPNIDKIPIPQLLKELIKSCWDENPKKRLNANEIYTKLSEWKSEIYKKNGDFYQQYLKIEEEYRKFSNSKNYISDPNIPYSSKKIQANKS